LFLKAFLNDFVDTVYTSYSAIVLCKFTGDHGTFLNIKKRGEPNKEKFSGDV